MGNDSPSFFRHLMSVMGTTRTFLRYRRPMALFVSAIAALVIVQGAKAPALTTVSKPMPRPRAVVETSAKSSEEAGCPIDGVVGGFCRVVPEDADPTGTISLLERSMRWQAILCRFSPSRAPPPPVC